MLFRFFLCVWKIPISLHKRNKYSSTLKSKCYVKQNVFMYIALLPFMDGSNGAGCGMEDGGYGNQLV